MQIATTHKNTDFDALAATIAATLLYPDAVAVLPGALNPNVRAFLSIHKDLFPTYGPRDVDLAQARRLIVVDVNQWHRLDGMQALQDLPELDIHLWDHHMSAGDIAAGWQCQEAVGATVTLMVREFKKRRLLLTPMQATLFLIGLYEDTGNLSFPSTTAEDAAAAAFLLDRKADLTVLNSFLRPAYGERQKQVLFQMLKEGRRTRISGHSISIGRLTVERHVQSLALVVRMYLEIMNVDGAFGIFSNGPQKGCMVIGRAASETLDVGAIMRSLGGGGHPGAGSAMLRGVNPEAVEEMISALIAGNQQGSVQISDIMSFPVTTVEAGTTMARAAALLREKGCTGMPVLEGDRPVGVISRRDFRKIKKESQLKAPVKAYMSRKIVSIEPGKSPMEAARLMIKHDIGRLPVVEDDRMIGIITRSDSMLYFYDLLPD